ncbi:MAG TPA: tripartite tricarboxylate transporter substrate binding protein [Burkholderiales bacterium]|nr:tripartite tricarboxylate transporter substrate binding protein [Burkholderiales bacterium]
MKQKMLKIAAACVALFAASAVQAQSYPTKPVHFIVGYPAGGGSDTSARVTAAAMEKTLGQAIVVENKPGAGSLLGASFVARSEPDGYTILFGNATAFHPVFLKEGIDAAKVFDPITNLQVGGLIFAAKLNTPYNNLQELLAWSKANPGKLNFGSLAPSADLYMQMFKARTGLDYLSVPYKGDTPVIAALLSGEVDVALSNTLSVVPQVQGGKMKALWVTRSSRSSIAPTLPTLAELGVPGVVWEFFLGLWTPKGTPPAAVQRLQSSAAAAVKQQDIIDQFRKFGADPVSTTPAETLAAFNNEMKFWTEAAKLANYQPQ